MKWKNFITPIQKSEISGDVAYKILLDLFEYAGSKNYVSEAAAKSWLNGTRNCKASTYFPSGKADTESLFRYFRNRPESKLKRLQQIFQNDKNLDADSSIDVETDDIDIFCWSLINQFLDLLGFQRVDLSKDTIPDQEQSAEQYSNESPLIHNTNLPEERKTSIRSMILPHSDDCCYHCAYWNGDRKTFGAYTTPTYGICLKYNRREQLSSDLACNDYKKRKKLSGDW